MGSIDTDEGNVPWGKYTYALEGLATGCYLEGACDKHTSPKSNSLEGQRLRFRVELPARCFVLSVAVKLPNAPEESLVALEDIEIERTLSNGEYETVYDGFQTRNPRVNERPFQDSNLKQQTHIIEEAAQRHASEQVPDDSKRDSPTSVDQTSMRPEDAGGKLLRKKVMEVRRAADSLRLTIIDVDETSRSSPLRSQQTSASDNDSDTGEFRTLGVVVVGYVRGQTPASNRIKILLNSSAKLGLQTAKADRAEVDGLLGLAFLGNRRYRQAAELLQRASELVVTVAQEDAKSGCSPEEAYLWAAELNLLSAYAYFEHMPKSNDGISRLIHVANATKTITLRNSERKLRDVKALASEYLDLRTELLVILEDLLTILVQFLGESTSLAVKLASARMIEFVCEQLGCTVAKHLSLILNQVLRLYPECMTFGARERAAATSFSYDSMEDCLERLIDLCCRLFPLTEHSVLHKLYDNTLVPVFLDGFHESKYLCLEDDVEEEADELTATAVAQTLRVIYLVLTVIGADARVPASLVARILNILIIENGSPRTSLLLRRTALHAWDTLSKALIRSAKGNTIKVFAGHVKVLHDFIPRLLVDVSRPSFEYGEVEEESEAEIEIIKEEYLTPENNVALKDIFKRRRRRTEITDRHTLRRLLSLIRDICHGLNTSEEDEGRYTDVIVKLQDTISRSLANLFLSSLIDVSYHEAIVSGNGRAERNNTFEFGDIYTQLSVVSDILEQLFEAYWASLRVLPKPTAEEAVRNSSVRAVLGWCVDRLRYSAPPRGMLKLLFVVVKGLRDDLNTRMYGLPSFADAPREVTFIAIYRGYVQWFAQSAFEEAFDLMDSLLGAVEHDLLATDISLLIQGLGDQSEQFQSRTDASLELLANVVACSAPKRPDLVLSSLKALEDPCAGNQRISNGFPKPSRANTGSFTRRLQFSNSSRSESMSKSLYIHVVLASCFDRFDALARASKHRAGPSYMGEKIDAFVEHAALCVRCLHASARARKHRDYIAAVLGDIFSTCLAMQAHNDGRVRLAGFEIFAASLDVLFLAQETKVLLPQQPTMTNSGMAVMKVASGVPSCGVAAEASGPVTELCPQQDTEGVLRSVPSGGNDAGVDLVRSNSLPASLTAAKPEEVPGQREEEFSDEDTDVEKKMLVIFEEGGSCSFQGEEASSSDFLHEEKGWQMLCAFVQSSLGIGKYVDVVVQRACLEYLKGCMLSALGGKSTGASVIAFEHIELLWESVNRLVGSPWRALNGLALWVTCTIVNVAIYCSVMVKGKGAIRQRSEKLHDFAFQHVFPKAESFLKHGSRETRIWGMRLLEVYIKARDLNNGIMQTVPPPPFSVLRTLENLKHDWDDEVRESCEFLLESYNSTTTKKSNSQATSFTAQAQNFMSMKRYQLSDIDGSDSTRIELWFPALPSQPRYLNVDLYCRTLEGFANTEVEGGEETEVVRVEEENDENEVDFDGEYEEDEDNYEYEEEDKEDLLEGSDNEEKLNVIPEATNDAKTEEGNAYGEGGLVNVSHELNEQIDPLHREENGDSAVTNDGKAEQLLGELLASGRTNDGSTRKSSSLDEEDDVDDFEFAKPGKPAVSPTEADTPPTSEAISKPETDPRPSDFTEARNESDDDFVDEDEVVNVTDEDDVLADLDSVPPGERLPRRSSRPTLSTSPASVLPKQGSGEEAVKITHSGSASRSSPSLPKPELNPDLNEGVYVLRRRGSFTSRPSKTILSEEGEAPRLARRRSLDVAALSSVIDTGGETKAMQGDVDVQSPSSMGSRLSRQRSGRHSPRDVGKSRNGETPSSTESASETLPKASEDQTPSSGRVLGRISSKDSSTTGAGGIRNSLQQTVSLPQVAGDEIRGEAFLNLSPTGSRVARGVKLEDEEERAQEVHPQLSPGHGSQTSHSDKPRTKSRPEKSSSYSKPARRLPRAPAFLKGGGPQRRIPAPLPIGSSVGESTERISDSHTSPTLGVGTPSARTESSETLRTKLPRVRSQSGKLPRTSGGGDAHEKIADRSHRFSRREPLRLPIGESEEPDKDLLDDLETGFDEVDDLGNRMRVGTPTADALKGRRNLADDQPTSGYQRRTAKRDVTDSEHYRSLVDQMAPATMDAEPRGAGSGPRREEGR